MTDKCTFCYGDGTWDCECCNGSGGCSCRGQPVFMGKCHVCNGTGVMQETSDPSANSKSIAGKLFLGSGPKQGWAR